MKFKIGDLVTGTNTEDYYYGGINMNGVKGVVISVDKTSDSYDVEFRLIDNRVINYRMHERDLLSYEEPNPKKLLII